MRGGLAYFATTPLTNASGVEHFGQPPLVLTDEPCWLGPLLALFCLDLLSSPACHPRGVVICLVGNGGDVLIGIDCWYTECQLTSSHLDHRNGKDELCNSRKCMSKGFRSTFDLHGVWGTIGTRLCSSGTSRVVGGWLGVRRVSSWFFHLEGKRLVYTYPLSRGWIVVSCLPDQRVPKLLSLSV